MKQHRRYDEAIGYFMKAIDLDPRLGSPHLGLGFVLLAQGDREGAITHLHEALARTPADPVASDLLRIALEDAANFGNGAVLPGLSTRIITALDRDVEAMFKGILAPSVAVNGLEEEEESQDVSMLVEDSL